MNKAFLISLIVLISSCTSLLESEAPINDKQAVFEHLWSEMDERYSYFDYKGVDWDSVKTAYQPLVDSCENDVELFSVLFDMMSEVRDGHVNLISSFQVSRYPVDLLGQKNFEWRIIEEHYLSQKYYQTGPFTHELIQGNVGYVRYGSFSSNFSESQLDLVLKTYESSNGIILDLRSNGGGSLLNAMEIFSRFISTTSTMYYSRIKTGPEHNNFSEWEKVDIDPSESYVYTKPVILLTDRGSYSATSFLTLGMRELDQVTVVGDTTGGGLGVPNGGQLVNGWTYRCSTSQSANSSYEQLENGIPPDVVELLRDDMVSAGRDNVLERAIQLLQ